MTNDIVFRRRGLSWLYYFFIVCFVALGVLLLMVALGQSLEAVPWRNKWFGVVGFATAGLTWLCGIPSMWSMGKSYGKNEARFTASGFSLHTAGGNDLQFEWKDVRKVTWNAGLQSRLCEVETDTMTYRFDARSCPRTKRVAHLVAERSGQVLQDARVKP